MDIWNAYSTLLLVWSNFGMGNSTPFRKLSTMNQEIYLDGNATTCVLPAAIDAAVQAMRECFGNPSSTHASGL